MEKSKKADFHIHSKGSFDGYFSIEEIIEKAKKEECEVISITDHNSVRELNQFFINKKNILFRKNGIFIIPGVEVTCKISYIPNYKGNGTKIHLLGYGFSREENSPIMRLLKLKERNDKKYDYGTLLLAKKILGIENSLIQEKDILEYIEKERVIRPGFQTLGKYDVINFLNWKNIKYDMPKNKLIDILSEYSQIERLNLEADDIITLIHASGGLVIMAHPKTNLDRTPHKKEVLNYLVRKEIDGFEYFSKGAGVTTRIELEKLKQKNKKLFLTGGSDYHGNEMLANRRIGYSLDQPILVSNFEDFIKFFFQIQQDINLNNCSTTSIQYNKNSEKANEILKKYEIKNREINSRAFRVKSKKNITIKREEEERCMT